MRIREAEYRMDEQKEKLLIFGIKFKFSKLKKKSKNFPNFTISKIIQFLLSTNS